MQAGNEPGYQRERQLMTEKETHADVVIVGASHAGSEAASRLRQGGFAGSIALLGAESYLPYQRPPLSKAFLAGETTADNLAIRSAESYVKAKIDFYPSTQVETIDRASHRLHLASGNWFDYGKLILATGGRPRRLTIPGSDLKGLHYMRSIADVDALRPDFTSGSRLVIVGGGYIGLEVAAVAVKHGLDVEIVEFAPRVLARVARNSPPSMKPRIPPPALNSGSTLASMGLKPRLPTPTGLAPSVAAMAPSSRLTWCWWRSA
jgi:3-phenylpropionate/trans-cinnamate dioxygenase ferredoxin reductase subunit